MKTYIIKSTLCFAPELYKAYPDKKYDDIHLINAEDDEIEPVIQISISYFYRFNQY